MLTLISNLKQCRLREVGFGLVLFFEDAFSLPRSTVPMPRLGAAPHSVAVARLSLPRSMCSPSPLTAAGARETHLFLFNCC